MRKIKLLFILFILFVSNLQPQISLTGSGIYSQDFNTLANTGTSSTVPAGWDFLESGGGSNDDEIYATGTGSDNEGNTYSFGASGNSERAFGGIQTGTLIPTIGASFTNNTGFAITQIPISYTGEQWRLGTLARTDQLDFQYSLDATSLSTGTWIDVNNLDFTASVTSGTVGALDGNAIANRTLVTFTITGLSISNGSTFWIRWIDFNATGSDDGLAIDDFSIDQTNLPVELSAFSALVQGNTVNLKWQTKTETNNYGFEVERASSMTSPIQAWTKIGFVNGSGNSNSPKEYNFTDRSATNGKFIYRLKQIDTDGKYEFSKEVEVDLGLPNNYSLGQNYPNPFNPTTKINYTLPINSDVQLLIFTVDGEFVKSLVNEKQSAGSYTIDFEASGLASGTYIYKLIANDFIQLKKMLLIK